MTALIRFTADDKQGNTNDIDGVKSGQKYVNICEVAQCIGGNLNWERKDECRTKLQSPFSS